MTGRAPLEALLHLLAPLEAALGDPAVVQLTGAWTTRRGLSYADPSQLGSGAGPYVENVYATWAGDCVCEVPLVGVLFGVTPNQTSWIKTPPLAPAPASGPLPMRYDLRLAARVGDVRATFGASLGGAMVPGCPIAIDGDAVEAVTLSAAHTTTGRPHVFARSAEIAFVMLLFRATDTRTGRNRIWRLRERYADGLPEAARALVTRKRGARWTNPA